MKLPRPIKRILLEKEAVGYDMTRRILARLPRVPVEVIQDREALKVSAHNGAAWLPEAKATLLLAVQKGPFWRPCPGTKDYVCCGYQVLQVTLNCPMDCTYCVLQGYVNVPAITIFVNVEDLFDELETRWAESPERVWRLGTGEFGDSLALDDLMGLNERLIPQLAGQRQAVLEIKSKWPHLDHLLPLGPNPQVIFAWSLNPPEIISGEEKLAASLKMRLNAASRAAAAGFRVAFHFDPLIYFPGWEKAYRQTVEAIGAMVPSQAIAWISLGGLRFLPPLRQLILQRFPQSRIAAQEMVLAPDGKLRYFKNLRVEMYARMREWLSQAAPEAFLYLCMESPRVWQEVFGFTPPANHLSHQLDGRIIPCP
ncbi:MAG: SPL family radical SAM protein [Desulfobaccales bacterium]